MTKSDIFLQQGTGDNERASLASTFLRLYPADGGSHKPQRDKNLIPPLSARGCIQSVQLAPLGCLERNNRGELMLEPVSRKYSITIEGEDVYPPAITAFDRGQIFCVESLLPLSMGLAGEGEEGFFSHVPVDGSVSLLCEEARHEGIRIKKNQIQEEDWPLVWWTEKGEDGKKKALFQARKKGFISFRPCFLALLLKFSIVHWEWEGRTKWKMELEER